MKRVEDERIRFFLKHRSLIEQWARIEKDLPAISAKFLWSLQEDMEELIARLDGDVYLYREAGNTPKLFLHRESWLPKDGNLRPMVGIGIEWQHKRADFGKGTTYVGIWNDQRSPATQFNAELTKVAAAVAQSKKLNATAWWPERTFVEPPNENYWEDLTLYRDLIIEEIHSYWVRYEARVGGVLQVVPEDFDAQQIPS